MDKIKLMILNAAEEILEEGNNCICYSARVCGKDCGT